jgi:hypothetical protein
MTSKCLGAERLLLLGKAVAYLVSRPLVMAIESLPRRTSNPMAGRPGLSGLWGPWHRAAERITLVGVS